MRLLLVLLSSVAFGQLTNTTTYSIPSPPTLPAAGSYFTDPTFSTSILRVTDAATDATGCWHDYSYWDAFNLDSTRLVVQCSGGRYWFDFNPKTLALGARHSFPLDPNGNTISGDGSTVWSSTASNVVFVTASTARTVWTLNLDTSTFTLVKTFSSGLPVGSADIQSGTISRDDNIFVWRTTDGVGNSTGCIAWRRYPDSILNSVSTSNLDECQVFKGGTGYVYKPNTSPGVGGAAGTFSQFITLPGGTVTAMNDATSSWSPHHSDNGTASLVGMNGYYPDGSGGGPDGGSRLYRTLATPNTFLAVTPGVNSDGHISFRADNEQFVCFEYYVNSPDPGGQFHGEAWCVSTDGNTRTQRVAHHQSDPTGGCNLCYRAQPQAVISRDFRFMTYNSNNMVAAGRVDVFVAVLAQRSITPVTSVFLGAMH